MRIDVSSCETPIVRFDFGLPWRAADDQLGIGEVVRVVSATLGERKYGRHRCSSPARSPRALLVVLALRRHSSQSDCRQGTDVNSDLHCRRTTKDIDWWLTCAQWDI